MIRYPHVITMNTPINTSSTPDKVVTAAVLASIVAIAVLSIFSS